MKTWLHKTPFWLRKLYPTLHWHESRKEKRIYLTFDDGPTENLCGWILSTLEKFDARATFFCVGENLSRYSASAKAITESGHRIANHTHNHLKGWQHSDEDYVTNILKCEDLLNQGKNKLFRPPYGQIRRSQASKLRELGYKVVMWDVLSGDFDPKLSVESCLKGTLKATRPGSVVVFHDNIKSESLLKAVLPVYLGKMKDQGFEFAVWE